MTKEVRISNDHVEAVISSHAAEVISFKSKKDDIEMIWCRDPQFWTNCNPILFPYTGALINGQYELDGQVYQLGQHGFARHAEFEFEEVTEDSCRLSLTYNEQTLAVYPFKFKLSVRYTLNDSRLSLSYRIENLEEEKDLPFNIGFHPAFNAPMTADRTYEDYRIELEQIEDLTSEQVQIGKTNTFELKDHLVQGSWFFHNGHIRSRWAQLTDGTHTIRVGTEGYATLGFWRKTPETPFMCIEPWHPFTRLQKAHTFRPDIENNLLPAGEDFHCGYYFEII